MREKNLDLRDLISLELLWKVGPIWKKSSLGRELSVIGEKPRLDAGGACETRSWQGSQGRRASFSSGFKISRC